MFKKGDRMTNKLITRGAIESLVSGLFPGFSAHSLRAGFISESFAAGATTSEVSRQSWHKSISSLMLYYRNQVTRENRVSKVI